MSLSAIGSSHFMGLLPKLESPEFIGLEIKDSSGNLSPVLIEPLHGEQESKLFRVYEQTNKSSQVVDTTGVITLLSESFRNGYDLAICKTDAEHTLYSRTSKGVRISKEPVSNSIAEVGNVRVNVNNLIESPRIRDVLIELGILTKEGNIRREQYNKLIQIKNFLGVVYDTLPSLRGGRALNIVDGACGKSYLSFILYHFLREEWRMDARFQCMDTNDRLIVRCQQIQHTLSYREMEFYVDRISNFKANQNIDLFYSLHGCDTATDEAIAAGVRANSKVIIVVPCCHFELRGQLRRHPLKGITKFGLFEERFATLLTDALRALTLEAKGYDVSTFRFVTDDISPKNTLICAIKSGFPKQQSIGQYLELTKMFSISPMIGELLPISSVQGRQSESGSS